MARVTETPPPTVAVVIPCFNDGATLEEAVDSARRQGPHVDVVVVDDGSTEPATIEVFKRLEQAGTRVVSQPNSGLSAARMRGVEESEGPYVFALDADDRLTSGILGRLVDVLERHPEAVAAWGDYRVFGDVEYVQRTSESLAPWQLSYQNDLPACALLRRRALLDVGGWQEPSRFGYEDWDLWMALAEHGWRGIGLPEVVYEYRVQGPRLLAASAARHEEIYDALRARHPRLFAERRRAWRQSPAPWLLRIALPLIELLPVSRNRKRLAGGLACHLANRRGIRVLLRRLRQASDAA